jgi:membrane-bound lytic murein transglycosylase MltF
MILQPGQYIQSGQRNRHEVKRKRIRLMQLRLADYPYTQLTQQVMAHYLPMWDWRWAPAQLWQESAWKPDASNPSGALGIAQFMPDTWGDMIEQLDFPADALRTDPQYAIPAYAHYMAQLRGVWTHVNRPEDDRRRLAMAAYNAGTGHIVKAQRLANNASDYATIVAQLARVTGLANAHQTTDYVIKIEQWFKQLAGTPPTTQE